MLPFHNVVESDFIAVNNLIVDRLQSDVGLVENIGHYIVDAGGKRLRPLLVLLTARCLNYTSLDSSKPRHIDLAAVIEFIHTATLLHDDVVDVSALRRGRPTANAKWGNAPSVLVGDFLYSRAFQMLVEIGEMEIMKILSDTTNIISEGEVQQLANARDPSIDEARYLDVILKKTAALFQAAAEAMAVLADSTETQRRAMRVFGQHLGLAFQLIDDVLDYDGDTETLGKNVGDDLAEGKPTLPLIYAMRNSSQDKRALIETAITEGDVTQLEQIVAIVAESGGLQYTKEKAKTHAKEAEKTLNSLPDNRYRSTLIELAQFSVERAF